MVGRSLVGRMSSGREGFGGRWMRLETRQPRLFMSRVAVMIVKTPGFSTSSPLNFTADGASLKILNFAIT